MEKYQSYKPSGVEWIGEIPVDWKVSKYKYNLSILSGFPFKSELFDNENGFPLLRIRDITSGTIETYYNGDFDDKYIIKKGDVVIGMDGDFNIREWDNDDILLNQRCCKIQGYDNLLLKFIFYTLPIDLKIINDLTYYTTVKHLSVGDLYNINCVLPSLNEQTQIVRFLDEKTELIDRLISTKELKISLLKEQRILLINQVVTKGLNPNVKMKDSGVEWIGKIPEFWVTKKMKYLVQICNGSEFKDFTLEEGGYPVYGSGGEFSRSSKFIYDKISVLLGRKGSVDKPKIVNEPFWCSDTTYYTKIKDGVNPYFFFFLVQQIDFKRFIYGSTIPSMTKSVYDEMEFPYPSINEQNEIVEFLDSKTKEIDDLVQLEQKKIDLLKQYRQSLISEVVTGKIKVTN